MGMTWGVLGEQGKMKNLLIALFVTSSTSAEHIQACNEGILLVGGETPTGSSSKISLLKPEGWCEQSGFPDLPEPVDNPAAYYGGSNLLVCGFTGESSCKYTARGWNNWVDSFAIEGDSHFQMTYSSHVGSVMMTSKDKESDASNHIQHNPAQSRPPFGTMTHWMEIIGSPFNLSTTDGYNREYVRDISHSCLASFNGDLLLTGGSESQACQRCSLRDSQPYVGKWSVLGNSDGTGPPKFENEIIPDMHEAREAHACTEFDGGVLVSGGYRRNISQGPNGDPPVDNYNQKRSSEFFNGAEWIPLLGKDMNTPRSHFQLQPMCGAVVAIGGGSMKDGDPDYLTPLSSVEQTWSIYGEWVPAPYFDLPEPLVFAASASVIDMDCWID